MTLLKALVGALVFAMLLCVWRAWDVFRRWIPAAADVEAADTVSRIDAYGGGSGLVGFGRRNNGVRLIRERISYDGPDGVRRHVAIRRWVSRDWLPDRAYVIWCDPANPARVTPYGPFFWLGAALLLSIVLVGALLLLGQLAHPATGAIARL